MSLDLLTVIVDANPCWWWRALEENEENNGEGYTICRAIDAIVAFCDAYRLLSSTKKLMVIGAGWSSSSVLHSWHNTNIGEAVTSSQSSSSASSSSSSSKDDEANASARLKKRLNNFFGVQCDECASTAATLRETKLAAPLAQALCYTNRLRKENQPARRITSRILILKVSDDTTTEHMSLMNIFFTAQKQHVLIDSCMLLRDSALMQQACDITGGIYSKVEDLNTLMQYLLFLFLPNTDLRCKLQLPTGGDVDYRPVCFCHQNLISIGWVCSVCLSVFCKFSPICPTCQTVFKFLPVMPKMVKKRKVTTK